MSNTRGQFGDYARDRVLPVAEVADRCSISIATFKRLVSKGLGPKITELSARRQGVRESHLVQWLDSRVRQQGDGAAA